MAKKGRAKIGLSVLKSPKIRHWLMSALRGEADIRLMSAMGHKRTLDQGLKMPRVSRSPKD